MSQVNGGGTSHKRAKEFLVGNLISTCVNQLKVLDAPFNTLSEAEQELVIQEITGQVKEATKHTIQIIASDDRTCFRAEVDSVRFRDEGVRADLKIPNTIESHQLADVAGRSVLIVIEDTEAYIKGEDGHPKASPDQGTLKSV